MIQEEENGSLSKLIIQVGQINHLQQVKKIRGNIELGKRRV